MVGRHLLVFILLISRTALSFLFCPFDNTDPADGHITALICSKLIVVSSDTQFNFDVLNADVQNIAFINSTINVISNQLFKPFPATERIFLNKSQVKVIGKTPFIGLHKLEELYLQDNLLTKLTQDVFTDLAALQFLNLHNNQISSMDDNVFQGLVQRDLNGIHPLSIDLSNNKLTYINDKYFKDLNQLNVLELQCNIIANISVGAFRDLDNMTKLNLNSNQLEHLEIGFFSALERLSFLDLSKNKLIAFNVNELNLNVRHLFINYNMLTYLDLEYLDKVLANKKLQYLWMNNNRWTCSWLAKAVQLFEKYKIKIMRSNSNSFNVPNIKGIHCIKNETINLSSTNTNPISSLATDISTSDTPQTSTHQCENDAFSELLQLISDAIN